MKGKYTATELIPDFDRPDEQLRLHNILTDLFDRTAKRVPISESEKSFICGFLKTADGDTPPFDTAEICSSYNFKFLFYVYYRDLSGGSVYVKPDKGAYRVIEKEEAAQELGLLKTAAAAWEDLLADQAGADLLMRAGIKEFNFEMQQLQASSAEYQSRFLFGGRNKYSHDVLVTVLTNKFNYLTTKEILEDLDSQDLILTLNGKDIIINEHSIFHIVNRHFGEVMKRYNSKKSFHNENFHPRLLNRQLKDIFDKINQAGVLNVATLKEIYFQYSGDIYKIYTTDRANHTGDIFLSTFFPLTDPAQLQLLAQNFNSLKIDNDINVFQPK